MKTPAIDPNYDLKHLMAEIELKRQPLHIQKQAVDLSTREEIAESSSERAPIGLVELVQRKVDLAMLNDMSPYEQGRVWITRNDFQQATQHFEAALASGDLRAHNNLGWIAVKAGEDEKAWHHFESIPKSSQLSISRATLHLIESAPKQALATGKEANTLLKHHPPHMQYVFGGELALVMGRAHRELDELNASAFYFRQGADRLNANAAHELGMLYMHPSFEGYNPQMAIRAFQVAISLGNPEGFRGIAMVLTALGEDEAVNQVLKQAALYGVEISEAERAQAVMERTLGQKLGTELC